jgi:steroid 5-alpha reductase family enzyme
VSLFQTFLLQGVLMWLISAPLLGAQFYVTNNTVNMLDAMGIILWFIGITFEVGGDLQLAKFKANPINDGKLLTNGFWRYTRHPNYFGDSVVWWGYGLFCLGAGGYVQVIGSLVMTVLIIKVSGVALLEKSLKNTKLEYKDYIEKTNAFIPWFPKK